MDNFTQLKKKELVVLCKDLKITIHPNQKKKTLIEKIKNFYSLNTDEFKYSFLQEVKADSTKKESSNESGVFCDTLIEDCPEDLDYQGPPPIEILPPIIDFLIEKYEIFLEFYYMIADSFENFFFSKTQCFKNKITKLIVLIFFELFCECIQFHSYCSTLNVIKNDSMIYFKKNSFLLGLKSFLLFDYHNLFGIKNSFFPTFFVWFLITLLFPMMFSYYFNFTKKIIRIKKNKKKKKIFTFDPFIFSLSKVLIYCSIKYSKIEKYIEYRNSSDNVKQSFYSFFENYLLYSKQSGVLSLILCSGNILIALYSRFEEF